MKPETILLLLSIGLASGLLSGMVGVGGGIIIVPALVFFLGFSQQAAQGTSLGLLLLPVGLLAVFNYYKQGYIDWKVVSIMCIAFVIGGWWGSKLALTIPEKNSKKNIRHHTFLFSIQDDELGCDDRELDQGINMTNITTEKGVKRVKQRSLNKRCQTPCTSAYHKI
jgi:hypothetical protein